MSNLHQTRRASARLSAALLGGCALLPALVAGAAQAQQAGQLDEVIVTATKTGETALQSTPIAITAFTADQLSERGVTDVKGLVDYTPSLQMSDLTGYSQVFIRGIGSNTVFIGSDPSSTIHLDGVYLARPLSFANDFLDVERVEVLRGPQGTLYGRNSVGGTINIISRRPSETGEGEVSVSYGNYSAWQAKGYASGPLLPGSKLLGSIAVNKAQHEPWRKNVSTGGGVENENTTGVRVQLLTPVTERAELTLRGDFSRSNEKTSGFPKLLDRTMNPLDDSILGDFDRVSLNLPNRTIMKNYGVAAEFTYDLTDELKLKSLTAARMFRGSLDLDADGSSMNILRTLVSPIAQRQYSEELNLSGKFDRFSFVTGFFYFSENNREPLTLALPQIGVSHVQRPLLHGKNWALFGQGEYEITDQLSAVAGIRYTHEKKKYWLDDYWTFSSSFDPAVAEAAPRITGLGFLPDPFTVRTSKTNKAWSPKFGLNYKPTDGILLYASATRGFKSGGFDYGAPDALDAARGYAPEFLWAYEVGVKSDLLDKRLRVNLSGFYYDYSDLQVELFVPPANAITRNAATSTVKGIEAEIQAAPARELQLFANATFLDAKYDRYPTAFVNPFGTFDASGNRLNHAPKWSATIGGTYSFDLQDKGVAYIGADLHVQSTMYFTPANNGVGAFADYKQKQGGYGIVNARIGWNSAEGGWRAALIGRNLTDRDYVVGTAGYGAAITGRPGAPRTYAIEIGKKF